jgi:hypothetical protein
MRNEKLKVKNAEDLERIIKKSLLEVPLVHSFLDLQ